jgi:glycosyltransferase involved in cell wall biosynthesis
MEYVGFVNKHKKFFYENVDIFISPSKAEALGMTLVEAQACGTPVTGSNFGPIRETMLDGVTGFLVDYGDYRMLAERIRTLAHNNKLLSQLSRNARKRASFFSWKNITDCIETVYRGGTADLYGMIRL